MSDKKFINEVFGKPLSRQQVCDKIIAILKQHTTIGYADLYNEVYRAKNGTVPTGEILEQQLHQALIILIHEGYIIKPNGSPYQITGKGLTYTRPSKVSKALRWATSSIWRFIVFIGAISAVLAGIWYAIDLYNRYMHK